MKRRILTMFAALWFVSPAIAETTECSEITSVPTVITVQGIYCFKQHQVTSITSGSAIDVQANNVVIDLNGWKLESSGNVTHATGISAQDRKNITIRNGTISGFYRGIHWKGSSNSGHVIEDVRADQIRLVSFLVEGNKNTVRNNFIVESGNVEDTDIAYGVLATSATDTFITGNIISGIAEETAVYGINVINSTNTEIRGNSIFDLHTATSIIGVHLDSATNVLVKNNKIINEATGSFAIFDFNSTSTGVDCIGNEVLGYGNGSSGCDYSAENYVN